MEFTKSDVEKGLLSMLLKLAMPKVDKAHLKEDIKEQEEAKKKAEGIKDIAEKMISDDKKALKDAD